MLKTEIKTIKNKFKKFLKDWVVQTTKPKAFTEPLRISRHPTSDRYQLVSAFEFSAHNRGVNMSARAISTIYGRQQNPSLVRPFKTPPAHLCPKVHFLAKNSKSLGTRWKL